MESKIAWLGGNSSTQKVDETLVSVDTYTGEEVRMSPEQLAIVQSFEQTEGSSMANLMNWLGVETIEEAESFLSDLEN
jgi:hypothetical protein